MLKESEWNTINNILLELYNIEDIKIFSQKFMNVIRMLIPYTKGWFLLLDDKQNIIIDKSYFKGVVNNLRTDIKELGRFSMELHTKVGREIAEQKVNILITVGKEAEYIAKEAINMGMDKEKIYICDCNEKASNVLKSIMEKVNKEQKEKTALHSILEKTSCNTSYVYYFWWSRICYGDYRESNKWELHK